MIFVDPLFHLARIFVAHPLFSLRAQVWSWGIVVWEIFNMGGLPYDNINTNHEVMDAVAGGHRLALGERLESDKRLAKLAAMVEDSWDRNADARPSFKQLARKCEHLFEGLKAADSEDGDDSDTATVLQELQKDGYAAPNRVSTSIYVKRSGNDLYEDEIAKQQSASSESTSSSEETSAESQSGSYTSSGSDSDSLYEHER
jgi:Protein tyrosine and serine/threonine kinase